MQISQKLRLTFVGATCDEVVYWRKTEDLFYAVLSRLVDTHGNRSEIADVCQVRDRRSGGTVHEWWRTPGSLGRSSCAMEVCMLRVLGFRPGRRPLQRGLRTGATTDDVAGSQRHHEVGSGGVRSYGSCTCSGFLFEQFFRGQVSLDIT